MADEKTQQLVNDFKKWAATQESPDYTISFSQEKGDHIIVDTEFACGTTSFYLLEQFTVVEMSVVNKSSSEIVFYLHFELNDLPHAQELFQEMILAVLKQENTSAQRILLCCSSAITTSFFKEKLNNAVRLLKLNIYFDAVSYNNLFMEGYSSDVILLAPQISHEYDKVREVFRDKLVLKVPTAIFAAYNVSELLDFVNHSIQENDRMKKEKLAPAERMEFRNTPRMLIISVIVQYQSVRFVYRIYDTGLVTHEDEVIKQRFEIRDLEDMLDFEMARFPGIEMVCINSPGVFYKGHMTFRSAGIYDVDVQTMFQERYKIPFIFVNDANSMALGYYGLQKKTRNLSFYFHPRAARTAGVGNIVNGVLFTGRNNLAGEMQYVHKIIGYSQDPTELLRTPEGTLEVVGKYLLTIIANFDPEMIILSCDMIYDLDQLKDYLAGYMQREFIPELIKVDDILEYMFVGGMMMCIKELSHRHLNNAQESYRRHEDSENQL